MISESCRPGWRKDRSNTSHYDRKRDRIMWHIDWIFEAALDGELRVCSKYVDEN